MSIYDIYPGIIRDLPFSSGGGITAAPSAHILHISGDIYGVAAGIKDNWPGTAQHAKLYTVRINSSGAFEGAMSVLDSFDVGAATEMKLVHVTGDVYALFWTIVTVGSYVRTFSINPATGAITAIDGPGAHVATGGTISALKVAAGVYAFSSSIGFGGSVIYTWAISDAGVIGAQIDSFNPGGTSNWTNIFEVAAGIYGFWTQTNGGDQILHTIDIDGAGNIGAAPIDSQSLAGGPVRNTIPVGPGMFAFISGSALQTLGIDGVGNINPAVTDSLAFGVYGTIAHITGDYYAVAYRAWPGSMYVSTVDIDAAGNIGSVLGTSPAFEASDAFAAMPWVVVVSPAATGLLAAVFRDSGMNDRVHTFGIGDWQLPAVTTQAVTVSTRTAHGTVINPGAPIGSAYGFVFNTTGSPTLADTVVNLGVPAAGAFSSFLSGLISGQTYYVRSYVTNAIDTVYGNEVSFAWGPTVTTQQCTDVLPLTATGHGTIVAENGHPVTQHGHCWSTSPNPTIADFKTLNGAGAVGPFTSAITGLNPTNIYHVRAYATNLDATSYGEDVILTFSPLYVCVAAEYDGSLTIINASAPTSPAFTGNIQSWGAPNFLDGAVDIKVVGQYAYVVSHWDNALSIFDISDPGLPVLVGSLQGGGAPNWLGAARGIDVVGSFAYIAASNDNSFTIVDVSDPAAPVTVGSIQAGSLNLWNPAQVKVILPYAYVTAEYGPGLFIFDVTDPAAPVLVGSLEGWGAPNFLDGAYGIDIVGNYAYIAARWDDSLTVVDISNPAAPTFVGHIDGADAPNFLWGAIGVRISGNYACVVSERDAALSIFDIANPAAPALVGSLQGAGAPNFLDYAHGIALNGDYAYIAVSNDNALTIIDISNPAAPVLAGSIQGAEAPNWLYGAAAAVLITPQQVSTVPVVETYGVTNIGLDSAILIGKLTDDGGEACEVGFQWGLTALYGQDTTWQGGKHTGDAFWQIIASLDPDTTYHFRAQGRNSVGTGYGEDMAFKTKRKYEAQAGVPYSILDPSLLVLMEEGAT